MAAATTVAPVEFNPTRQGKFKVLIGDSLKPGAEDGQSPNVYSSFRYNTAPPSGPSKLSQTDNGQFNLLYEDDRETSYTGAQRPGRKLECILVYNPKDNTFTLERTSSIFTFNQSHPFSEVPSIPAATYEDEVTAAVGNSDDEDAQLADAENPFDVRHFTSRVLPNSDEDDDEREDQKEEDTDVEMEDVDPQAAVTEPEQEQETAVTPGQSASTPIPASSATPIPNPSLGMIKRKTKAVNPFMKPTRKPKAPAASNAGRSPLLHPDMAAHGKEASMSPQPRLPSPMHIDRKPAARKGRVQQKEESSESDADSSDEENNRRRPPPVNKHIQSVAMSREPSFSGSILSNNAPDELEFPDPKSEDKGDGEDDDFDLDKAMAEEFDFMEDDDEGEGGGGGELTIEGEDENRSGIGLGIGNISSTAVPVSLSSMMGGRRRDESEEESSEEE
ncbi:hypothetical protein TWF569_001331 [Orbilia oligospora]|uniref:Transcription elongation factor Eaf N-terminal domain-containing protein n=1 Tax=Orbilia oligospora TaxID=2813651 RepID=A0A7C8NRH7_ORBOL|nr:hypothetical protein TWF102_011635 [Orbilia oligospora]KAF3089545.1 hypothetical protein TWF706_010404 [Orbilia oligospora]KAF3095324.1 hypothetical protein TWF103_010294 [Orbilia oligospora]KAF3119929.1 hypothetical protein TWF594_004434 [Orbilia oligospora]KAF3124287.1 hypothetical protein TWF569_001331 [Orbilia oligospora]